MTVAFLLDILVACLLVATIAYAAVLNRKLGRLRSGKAELEALLASFQQATVRAEASISALRTYADASHDDVEEKRTTIKGLRDDIDFLVSRASEQADRLEALIRQGRDREGTKARGADGLDALIDEIRRGDSVEATGAFDAPAAANDRAGEAGPGSTPPWKGRSGRPGERQVLR